MELLLASRLHFFYGTHRGRVKRVPSLEGYAVGGGYVSLRLLDVLGHLEHTPALRATPLKRGRLTHDACIHQYMQIMEYIVESI